MGCLCFVGTGQLLDGGRGSGHYYVNAFSSSYFVLDFYLDVTLGCFGNLAESACMAGEVRCSYM